MGAALLAAASPAAALNGRADVRTSHQEGRSGSLAYTTNSLRENYSLGLYSKLSSRLFLNVDALARRETLDSQSGFAIAESDKTTLLPNFTLSYRGEHERLGLSGRATRIDQVRTGQPSQRDEYLDINFWLNTEFSRFQIDANAQQTAAWRYADGSDRENREQNFAAMVLWNLTNNDDLSYRFSRSRQDIIQQDLRTTYTTHNVQYRGDHRFLDDRGHLSLHALSNRFIQNDHRNDQFDQTYVQPLGAAYSLDDTPDFLDPLEDDPVSVPALLDNDRDTATEINIGDNASVVREYGGDYRNIILDFGEPAEMISAVLYIDHIVSFPGLMQWQVFVSDDPQGRDWGNALSPGSYTLRYFESETGRQGWRLDFNAAITHRRLKLVNSKLGLTEPDIFVTEFEVYQTTVTTTADVTTQVINNRLDGEVSYALTRSLTARYSANVSDRRYDDDNRNLRGVAQLVGANYRFSDWVLTAQHETHTLRGPSRRDTDANSQLVSLSSSRLRELSGRLSYNRSEDKSYTEKNLTHSVTGDVSWRVAPLLVFNQKLSYGERTAPDIIGVSQSWVLVSELRGTPRPSFTFELRRADRWVSQEAGSGFTTFNDTDLTVTWAILPLVQISSQAIYQVRETEDWYYRNNLSWTPLPGGSLLLRFQVNDQQDTRTDYKQRGGGASLTWRPRPTLNLGAGIEKSRVEQYGEKNDPLSYNFRGSWTF